MDLDKRICDRARKSRDARFDGKFFIAVTTTGVYCRPICPVRGPKDAHIRYYATAAAAEAAGYRPCLRCRPEASPGSPAWLGTSSLVSRALRLIGEGALDDEGVERLGDRLGVTARHLRRLFLQHLGATPLGVALTRRVHFAKKLVDETSLPFGEIAFAAGFGSLRRFNGLIHRTFARTPTELRRLARTKTICEAGCYRFRLAYRPPYDWDGVLAFLRARATDGVESVDAATYRRTIVVDGKSGSFEVGRHESGTALQLDVRFPDPRALLTIVERVRRLFDLGADPVVIEAHLRADPLLARAIAKRPGVRTPGAWDGFELAVRAILGQQVSVRAATTIAGRIAAMFGSPVAEQRGLSRLFPTPAQLAIAPLERAGVMPARAATIRALATGIMNHEVDLSWSTDRGAAAAALVALPGVGRWTAEYIAMRALGETDALPTGDLVLRRAAGDLSAAELDRRGDAWRPWRSYAVMLLWHAASDSSAHTRRTRHAHQTDGAARARRPAGRRVVAAARRTG